MPRRENMARAPKKSETSEVEIREIRAHQVKFHIVGASPMIMHRFDQKAWRELLLPSRPMNAAEKVQNLKHDPIAEFRGGLYLCRDKTAETAIHIPAGAIHKSIGQAAIDIPGVAKAATLRLTTIIDQTVHLYGLPSISCMMTRLAGINSTPDVRTRPIFREWACSFTVQYIAGLINEQQIAELLAAAGHIVGLGDWRGQKGGSFGRFRVVRPNDPDFVRITKHQGREAQLDAISHPDHYDDDTAELLEWFFEEVAKREHEATASGSSEPKKLKRPKLVAAE
jgi:hypothetical protein